jgi:hypothetical protein
MDEHIVRIQVRALKRQSVGVDGAQLFEGLKACEIEQ